MLEFRQVDERTYDIWGNDNNLEAATNAALHLPDKPTKLWVFDSLDCINWLFTSEDLLQIVRKLDELNGVKDDSSKV